MIKFEEPQFDTHKVPFKAYGEPQAEQLDESEHWVQGHWHEIHWAIDSDIKGYVPPGQLTMHSWL